MQVRDVPVLNDLPTKTTINDLLSNFELCADHIDVLSLDCFDTLIWRTTAAPKDIFYDLQNIPIFKKLNISAELRTTAEEQVRALNLIKNKSLEATLNAIYRHLLPQISDNELDNLVETELYEEIKQSFALPAVVELIRLAHSKKKKIIIVSDTYLTESQLRNLLASKLPVDVMSFISTIFCSCEYGVSKSLGLFKYVVEHLKVHPKKILHIGDNPLADKDAARAYNLNALELVPADEAIEQIANMHHWAASYLDQTVRSNRSLQYPFRALFSDLSSVNDKPELVIGYMSAGPIMLAFGQAIIREVATSKSYHENVKVLFLMRDGYLPYLACKELAGEIGQLAHISRFTSFAVSFRTIEDIDKYLSNVLYSKRFENICRQLLLPAELQKRILAAVDCHPDTVNEFSRLIHQEEVLNIIFANSQAYRKRFKRYLKNELNIQSGDHVVLIDLGYSGTTQIQLTEILQEEMNISLSGYYLLSLDTSKIINKKGLLDSTWCDQRILSMLVNYIAAFEQICTKNQGSVIDYQEDGKPIFSESKLHERQHQHLQMIQKECVRFISEASQFIKNNQLNISSENLRDIARAEMGRFLFLPSKIEIDYLSSFQFDFNLGTDNVLNIFDLAKGQAGLRQRGMFFMERNLENMRTNYPAELRSIGLELSFTLMALERYRGKLNVNDFSLRREKIHIILIHNNVSTRSYIDAFPTYDGYYSLIIPLGSGSFQVGVQFGLCYKWFEIESAHLIPAKCWLTNKESDQTENVQSRLIVSDIVERDERLYECVSDAGLIAFLPRQLSSIENQLLRLIFRPIKYKQ